MGKSLEWMRLQMQRSGKKRSWSHTFKEGKKSIEGNQIMVDTTD
jgi:hypothetical protein